MGSSSNCGNQIQIKELVKLSDSNRLRISEVLVGCVGGMVRILSPFGKKLYPVKVGRDAEGAFLGDGWPEFVAAHGIAGAWYLVIRHVGAGILTLKVFDTTCFIKEFGLTITVLSPHVTNKAFARKPQFIVPLQRSYMEKMPIPREFLQRGYISEYLNRPRLRATFCLQWHIDLEKDGLTFFFAGSEWQKFLSLYDISETDVLLIKYEGCMNFSLETFQYWNTEHVEEETSSSQQSKQSHGAQSQDVEHVSTRKRRQSEVKSITLRKELGSTGSQASLRKEINDFSLKKYLPLPGQFGFRERCKITLKPVGSDESWKVEGVTYKMSNGKPANRLVTGWKGFCRDNELKKGDICTFKVVNSTMWHVDIERC